MFRTKGLLGLHASKMNLGGLFEGGGRSKVNLFELHGSDFVLNPTSVYEP